jgi:hypothetical protein
MNYHPIFRNWSINTPKVFRNYTLKIDSQYLETDFQTPAQFFKPAFKKLPLKISFF